MSSNVRMQQDESISMNSFPVANNYNTVNLLLSCFFILQNDAY